VRLVIDEHRRLAQVTDVIDWLFGDVFGGHLPMKVQIITFRRGHAARRRTADERIRLTNLRQVADV
jgi:hypothetical protein